MDENSLQIVRVHLPYKGKLERSGPGGRRADESLCRGRTPVFILWEGILCHLPNAHLPPFLLSLMERCVCLRLGEKPMEPRLIFGYYPGPLVPVPSVMHQNSVSLQVDEQISVFS